DEHSGARDDPAEGHRGLRDADPWLGVSRVLGRQAPEATPPTPKVKWLHLASGFLLLDLLAGRLEVSLDVEHVADEKDRGERPVESFDVQEPGHQGEGVHGKEVAEVL